MYVAAGMPESVSLSANEAIAILAKYAQARQNLHQKKLNRGYLRSQPHVHVNLKSNTYGHTTHPEAEESPRGDRSSGRRSSSSADRNARGPDSKAIGPENAKIRQTNEASFVPTLGTSHFGRLRVFARQECTSMCVAESSNGVFIGVTVTLGYALIGTGTQHAVIGSKAWASSRDT